MARMRSLRPDYFLREDMADVSLEAHFLLAGLAVLADRDGRMLDRPRTINAQVFPFRDVDVEAALVELVRAGVIARYTAGGKACIALLTWAEDQTPHPKETSLGLPPPPTYSSGGGDFHAPPQPSRKVGHASGSDGEPSRRDPLGLGIGCGSRDGSRMGSIPASQVAASAADAGEEFPDATSDAVEVPQRPTLELLPCPPDAPSAIAAFVAQAPLLPEAVATAPAKPKRTPAAKREPTGDSRHAPLVLALVEAHREAKGAPYGFQGGKDARAVSDLLMLADQDPATHGEAAPAEILRRWGIALRWRGFPACTGLLAFRDNWNAYVLESGASPTGNTTLKPTKFIEM